MQTTDIWQKFEKSKSYMNKKNLLVRTERNWNMYLGKQWEAIKDSDGLEDLPVENFIKQVIKYKVSTIAQHSVTALFSDLNGRYVETTQKLNRLFDISWERSKMDRVAWKALKESAIQGDSYVYFYGGDTRVTPQVLHNTQVFLGDENITDIQEQPYIIIEERLSPEVIKKRAKAAGCKKSDIDMITGDKDDSEILFNKEEVNNKVSSLLYMEKKDGIVHVARATKMVVYEELHPIQQTRGGEYTGEGLTVYPIVSMIWEEMPNYARGCAEVDELIANQLMLNKTLARRAISVKMTAFPRIAVDESSLSNPEDLEKVGATIKMNGGSAQSVESMIKILAPVAQAGDAKQLTDELLQKTKDLAGASDTALGNIDLSRVSGAAATTIRDQQQVPLNEQVAMYKDFVENVAMLYFHLWKAYFPQGVDFDGVYVAPEEIAGILPNIRIDIAENTTLSVMASQQELTNLFNNNKITFEEYVEAYPEHSSIPKDVLLNIAQKRQVMQQQNPMMFDENGQPVIQNEVGSGGVATGGAGGKQAQAIQSQLAGGLVQ